MKLVKLGNLASIQTGKIDVNKAVEGGTFPFFTCSRDVYRINDAPFEGKAVLVAGNGDLNVKYYEGKFNAYQRTYFLFVNDENELLPRYLYWFLESYVGQLRSESIGSTIKYIKMGNLTDAEIPLPSLEEQREIVEKLDNAFAEIDLLEKINSEAISLNQILLSTKINSEFSAFLNTQPAKSLGEYGKLGYGFTAKSSHAHNGPKYLRITDIQNKSVNWDDVPNCEISSEEKSKFKLKKGDIVFARTGATTGKSFLIEDEIDAVFASYLIRIEPNTDILVPKFLFYFFQSSYYWDAIAEGISGSAQGGFNASKLQAMNVNFPNDKSSQEDIVTRICDFETELHLRASILFIQSARISELRISLLSNAFIREKAVA